MLREFFSHERGLAMLHRENHVGVLDHLLRDRLRPVIHQFNTQCLRDPDGELRRRDGYPNVETRRAGTDSTQIPVSSDLPEVPPGIRTPADISLAYEEDGPGEKRGRRVPDPFPHAAPVHAGHSGLDPTDHLSNDHE